MAKIAQNYSSSIAAIEMKMQTTLRSYLNQNGTYQQNNR